MSEESIREAALVLTRMQIDSKECLSDVASACDNRLGLESGQSLILARHLIAIRQWQVDLTKPIHPLERLELISPSCLTSEHEQVRQHVDSKKHSNRAISR